MTAGFRENKQRFTEDYVCVHFHLKVPLETAYKSIPMKYRQTFTEGRFTVKSVFLGIVQVFKC